MSGKGGFLAFNRFDSQSVDVPHFLSGVLTRLLPRLGSERQCQQRGLKMSFALPLE